MALLVAAVTVGAAACGGTTPPPPPPPTRAALPPPPPPPTGPTRTDFKTIAKKLMSRCVGGGWINRWRADHEDVNVAKPRIFLAEFEDKTGQKLDPTYLGAVLAQRMRISGVFETVDTRDQADFIARGQLLRLAEGTGRTRYSVYTAILKMQNPSDQRTVHTCEATVKGEM